MGNSVFSSPCCWCYEDATISTSTNTKATSFTRKEQNSRSENDDRVINLDTGEVRKKKAKKKKNMESKHAFIRMKKKDVKSSSLINGSGSRVSKTNTLSSSSSSSSVDPTDLFFENGVNGNTTDFYLKKLQVKCPNATEEERRRFLVAKGDNYDLALEQLLEYLLWRQKYDLDDKNNNIGTPLSMSMDTQKQIKNENSSQMERTQIPMDDLDSDALDWRHASEKALLYSNSNRPTSDKRRKSIILPQLAFMPKINMPNPSSSSSSSSSPSPSPSPSPSSPSTIDENGAHQPMQYPNHVKCKSGNRLLQLLPAQMNPHLASDETYTLCIAFYLEHKLSRHSTEKITISIDVRSGKGWYNPKFSTMLPFIRKITTCLERNFPERMGKCIVFPMPRVAVILWRSVVVKFIDANTANKISIISSGGSGILSDAKAPMHKLKEHVGLDVQERMEVVRSATFT